jgi:hypothetical protein
MKATTLVLLGVVAGSLGVSPVRAQSLLSAGGLGTPTDALDARSRGIGGVAVGLFGPGVRPTDPVAAADLTVPSSTLTAAGSWIRESGSDASSSSSGTRFPAIGVSYPMRRIGVATLSYGSGFDQRWRVESPRLLTLGSEVARVTDRFNSEGGLSVFRLGFARRVAPSLAVGGSVGAYTGHLTRSLTRTFDSVATGLEDVFSAQSGGHWTYSGYTATVGATVDVRSVLRVAGNVTWSGNVEARPSEDTQGQAGKFDFPTEIRLGASGVLSPGLVASAGLSVGDWTAAGRSLNEESGNRALTVGGGLEWTQVSMFGRRSPFQLGYRHSSLPFTFQGEDASESAFTGGIGLDFSRDETVAGTSLSLERGSRTAGPISERFYRLSLTVRVSGY